MSRAMWPKLPSAPYCYCLEGLLFRLLELRWPLFRALDLQITAPLVHHGETTRTVPVTRFYPETPEFAIICRCVCKSMPLYGFARIFLKCRFVLQDFPCLLWNALGHNSVNARGTFSIRKPHSWWPGSAQEHVTEYVISVAARYSDCMDVILLDCFTIPGADLLVWWPLFLL